MGSCAGGRNSGSGGGGSGGGVLTNARNIENMNEAQLNRELGIAKRKLKKAQDDRRRYGGETSEDAAMREAFPLGAGGMSRAEAQRYAGQKSEQSLERSKKLSDAIEREAQQERRIDALEKAKRDVAGTGKTQKDLATERKKTAAGELKWKTTKSGNKTTYSADGITITHVGGGMYHFIAPNGNRYSFAKLSDAKEAVALLMRKRRNA